MNILLLGEYSRLHNSLKEGLLQLGHHVVLLGFNDGFKAYPVDLLFEKKWDTGFRKKIKVAVYMVSGFDISSYLTYRQFLKNKSLFEGYDVVQLINENSFFCDPYYEKKILTRIFKKNKKVVLLSCGDDYSNVKYGFENPEFKSGIIPYLEGKITPKEFQNVLKYRKESFQQLHAFLMEHITGIIASDIDYDIPLRNNPKYLGLIPNPINIDKIPFTPLVIEEKIIVFLGINTESYFKKGCDYFEKALVIIAEKYADKVETIITKNIPYLDYMGLNKKAHILLDMAYSYDQGYNALEAMAKGKIVFTGAETEFEKFYRLTENVAINAKPDVLYLVAQLSFLIENPETIVALGKRARHFVEKEHHYIPIAEEYLKKWN